ncbi:cytochrome P450 [Kutzneria sp. CA-103260]|uniref:cytochrome P450 n=1 Tax=Kutzneria sp. CA-103260 TaxID=2802641 RepID=UPI001BA92DC3|nr:cytochrome P450 [Kutzneria sp. CA-103260]QUQ68214.1 cytochrome P450 [Kutzneria sp. CA-103260]
MFPVGAEATIGELTADSHPLLARLRAAEPVSWLPALNGWLVTRHDLALQVMRDAATFTVDDPRFSTGQVVGPSMLSLDADEHARHRAPFSRQFRPREIADRFGDFVRAECDRLVDGFADTGRAELRRALAGPLAVAVVADALGLDGTDAKRVLAWYDAIVSTVADISAGRKPDSVGVEAFGELRAHIESSVARHNPSLLADAAEALALPEVVSNAAVLMFGGIETTEGMIANVLLHLLNDPSQMDIVRADRSRIPDAVEESLRMEPAAAVVDRYATRDVELAGASIRRGDLVTVSLTAANRDPAVFENPDVFDLRRPNLRKQLAFAHGPHFCLGVDLARLETRIAVETVLDRLPGLELTEPAEPTGLVFRKPDGVHVRWATA